MNPQPAVIFDTPRVRVQHTRAAMVAAQAVQDTLGRISGWRT